MAEVNPRGQAGGAALVWRGGRGLLALAAVLGCVVVVLSGRVGWVNHVTSAFAVGVILATIGSFLAPRRRRTAAVFGMCAAAAGLVTIADGALSLWGVPMILCGLGAVRCWNGGRRRLHPFVVVLVVSSGMLFLLLDVGIQFADSSFDEHYFGEPPGVMPTYLVCSILLGAAAVMALVSGLIAGVSKVPAALVAAAAVTLSAYGVSLEQEYMGASHWFVWGLAVLCLVVGHVYAFVGRGPA